MQTIPANLPLKKILISGEQITRRVGELGAQISKDYHGKTPLFLCILRGSALFYAELVKNITTDCHLDFMCLCSYSGTSSGGKVRMMLDSREDIKNRHVIIVEDIIDTGTTAKYITELLATRGPASVEICTLLDKPSNREVEIKPRYSGFTIENEFVVGYGLDYNELYRNLPFIGVFDESKQ
ncbi:MAG: hypoxanthine phosphoribosyltransferase [Elusimicrobiota bacterium]|jgi:hypoxanthine phosphoribosyltransferase|nr:hypoxanthine phosphoribosyltransferase [Elusimicrobiota bacterium]